MLRKLHRSTHIVEVAAQLCCIFRMTSTSGDRSKKVIRSCSTKVYRECHVQKAQHVAQAGILMFVEAAVGVYRTPAEGYCRLPLMM